tara:strand:+ start:855 stop:2096 length:1242 start_codon:yes stop_codon:yes gene_type:complete
MALQPYYRPTGSLLVPLSTQVLVGDSVSGPGILLGTTVVSITEVLGSPAIGNYLKITLSQEPSGFGAGYVPTGVTNHGHQSTSALTGHNLGYTSHITFTRGEGGSDFVDKTLSFKEDVKGWVSFKSFIPENGLSCANEYYTFSNARLWQHNREDVDRNTFYKDDTNDGFTNSLCTVLLNNNSGIVKSFNTLNYEGTQSRIQVPTTNDSEYFNLRDKDGWFVSGVSTDKEEGSLNEFIEKEGKWFNYIKGVRTEVQSASDLAGFNVQGIGIVTNITPYTEWSASDFQIQIRDLTSPVSINGAARVVYTGTQNTVTNLGFTYAWNNGGTGNEITGLPLGPVGLILTDNNGVAHTVTNFYSANTVANAFVAANIVSGCTNPSATNYDWINNTDCVGNIIGSLDYTNAGAFGDESCC